MTATASALRRAFDGLLLALTFLTVLPLRVREDHDGAGAAPAFYALVGAAIGLLAGGVLAAAEPVFGDVVAAILAVLALVVVTGALHQDGLADCADGLGVRGDRERRLRVMRDPANGTFGTLALLLWALLLTACLAQLDTTQALAALVTATALGRWAALLHAQWAPPARADGLGSGFTPTTLAVVLAGLSAILVAAVADLQAAGAATLTALAVAALVSWAARRAIGGRTGDTLGATVVLAELAVVLLALALARA
jgi:adenosylcobinamide-GDP ribazoletransferase